MAAESLAVLLVPIVLGAAIVAVMVDRIQRAFWRRNDRRLKAQREWSEEDRRLLADVRRICEPL